MNLIGKQVFSKGLNAGGLMDMLKGQRGFLSKAMPAGLGSILGFAGDGMKSVKDAGSRVVGTANTAATETAKAGGGFLKALLPLAFIAALAGGAYWYFTGGGNPVTDITDAAKSGVEKVGDVAGDVAGKVGDVAGDVAAKAGDVASAAWAKTAGAAKAALEGVKFAAGSVGESFSNFLGSGAEGEKTFKFNELKFATGKADIDASSMNEIDNLAKVLAAYSTVEIEIQGHTDATGDADANMTLSQARAESVMARLAEKGVPAARMTPKGYGQTMPADANNNDANRRVEIKVTKK